jgi:hypothetical protein
MRVWAHLPASLETADDASKAIVNDSNPPGQLRRHMEFRDSIARELRETTPSSRGHAYGHASWSEAMTLAYLDMEAGRRLEPLMSGYVC